MPAIERHRILIVDDNRSIHDDFAKIFAPPSRGAAELAELESLLFGDERREDAPAFELLSAYQGQQALQLVTDELEAERPIALAFVDMRMPPGWDGLETIERLWEVAPDLQVVICSAYSDHSWTELRDRLGIRDQLLILKKPFDTIEVLQLAHALTTKWALARQVRQNIDQLEATVAARTAELQEVNRQLAREIEHRDRVETHLRLAQKLEAVGQLAAGVAHEINTPVQFVRDNLYFVHGAAAELLALVEAVRGPREADLETLARRAGIDELAEEVPAALQAMHAGVDRIATIVRAMRELSHPGPRTTVACDLNETVENALVIAASSYRYLAEVSRELAPLPVVTCFPDELGQVFVNLITNAAHAIEDAGRGRGTITIRTRREGPDVVISITDTGSGIPPAIHDRLFDAFFTTKQVGRGTGQGLAISRAIVVDRHAGSLTFESELGSGTTFHVRIPIAGAERAAA